MSIRLHNSSMFTTSKDGEKDNIDFQAELLCDIDKMKNKVCSYISVEVSAGRNLAIKDLVASDPYILFTFVPHGCTTFPNKNSPRVYKSHYITQTLNPIWNYMRTCEFKRSEDIFSMDLMIEIWDYDFGRSDDFMGRVIIPIKDIKDIYPNWYTLQERFEVKEHICGDICVSVEVIPSSELLKMSNLIPLCFTPLLFWKFKKRLYYQDNISKGEVPEVLRVNNISKWEDMVATSLLEESQNMPRYIHEAYACLPPGSILCAPVKLISLSKGNIEDHMLRIYITGFRKENNLLEGYRIYRTQKSRKTVYIKFIPMQYGRKGTSALSKMTMLIIGERYFLRGPCMANYETRSLALYIPIADKFNYLPILARTDYQPTNPINGNLKTWINKLCESSQPIGELPEPLCKIHTIGIESEIEHQIRVRSLPEEVITIDINQQESPELHKHKDSTKDNNNEDSTQNTDSTDDSTDDLEDDKQSTPKRKKKRSRNSLDKNPKELNSSNELNTSKRKKKKKRRKSNKSLSNSDK